MSLADADEHVGVAGATSERSGVPLPAQPDALAIVDTGRNLDVQGPFLGRLTGAAAAFARRADDGSCASALRARLCSDELAEDG
jgi:hypothetical protein